jgi:hypothetical protein
MLIRGVVVSPSGIKRAIAASRARATSVTFGWVQVSTYSSAARLTRDAAVLRAISI